MAYYNPYFEDRSGKIESIFTYSKEEVVIDMKPPSYFLPLLAMNYRWTKAEGLDTFSFKISPSFVFWHDRLLDIYPFYYLRDYLFEMMDKAGLLNEPIMLMVEWARTIAPHKVKYERTKLDSKNEDDRIVVPVEPKFEDVWDSGFVEQDKKLFSARYDISEEMFQTREVPGVLNKNPKAPVRWLRFLVMNPKEN